MTTAMQLTADSLKTFLLYANDAGNWSGVPYVSRGNIYCTKSMRGNLSDLVKKDLITIHGSGDGMYIEFTETGKCFAAEHGCVID
jgi:hypothetical protein